MSFASPAHQHLALPGLWSASVGSPAVPSTYPSTASGSPANDERDGQPVKRRRRGGINARGGAKGRKVQSNPGDRELNEGDDVDDDELVAAEEDDRAGQWGIWEEDGGLGDEEGEGEGDADGDAEDAEVDGEAEAEVDADGQVQAGADAIQAQARISSANRGGYRGRGRGRGGQGGSKVGGRRETLYDEEAVRKRAAEQKELANLLGQVMDPEQAKRYEAFSTVVLPKHAVRKLVNNKVDQGIPDQLVGGLAGLAKVFVVQMTELATEIQAHSPNPTGPLQPYHLRLAREIMVERGLLTDGQGSGSALRPRNTARHPR